MRVVKDQTDASADNTSADNASADKTAGAADDDEHVADGVSADEVSDDEVSADEVSADEPSTQEGSLNARHRRRGIFLLPNLITTAALFAGFFAIVAGMNGNFIGAALAIIAAGLLDTADGRVARWTRTESQFGAEYDSLSDMVAFGVAPALVAFSWGLDTLGQFGWVATFLFMACAALRLARFNTNGDNKTFTGLASPSAAAIIACAVWTWADSDLGNPSPVSAGIMATAVVAIALLMVSNISYYSPKVFDLKGRVPFVTLVVVVLIFAVLFIDPPRVLLFLSLVYAFSGPVQYLWRRFRKRRARRVL